MLKTKRARAVFAFGVALTLYTGFYAAIAQNPLKGALYGFGVPVGMVVLAYSGWRVARWIEKAR